MTLEPTHRDRAVMDRLDDRPAPVRSDEPDPGLIVMTCANCGATMGERKCKLICTCGYFLSCSDYH